MHKSAIKCNETIGKWCKNKHGASKIIDTFETYQSLSFLVLLIIELLREVATVANVLIDIVLELKLNQKWIYYLA
jgi:hypothetical protein